MTVQGTAGDQFSFASFEQEYQSFGNSLLNLTPAQVVKAYNDWVAKQRERMARQDSSQRGRQFKSPQEEIQDCNEALARERARFHSQRRGGDPYSAASQRFMGDPYSYESQVQVQGSGRESAPARASSQVKQGSAPPSQTSSSGYGGSINTDKACPNCSVDTHKFENCRKFKALPIQERLDFVQRARLCFKCLQKGHISRDCNKSCQVCGRRHHVQLHDQFRDSSENKQASVAMTSGKTSLVMSASKQRIESSKVANAAHQEEERVWMCILPVVVHGKSEDIKTYAFLDSGSNTSLMTKGLFKKLGVNGTPVDYAIRTLNSNLVQDKQFEGVVDLSSIDKQQSVSLRIMTVNKLPIRLNGPRRQMDKWPHLARVDVDSIKHAEVGILVGMDCPELHWSLEELRGGPGEPFARRTLLGWSIVGPTVKKDVNEPRESRFQVVNNLLFMDQIHQQLQAQWNADFRDLQLVDREAMSVEDRKALQIMQDSVKQVNGKFQVAIPWRTDPDELPNNRREAENRLRSLKRKFIRDPSLHTQYTATLTKYINDGHARKVESSEIKASDSQWYLPHHPVFKKSNPSKCRVVFDCAAKYKGTSLNDIILQGPNFMNSLAGVLLRFRRETVAIVGDIQAMFHQCYVTARDERFLRFLWWNEGNYKQEPSVYCMCVHLFGATSSPSVANFCMKKTADDNETRYSDQAIDVLRRSFYVDDMLKSVSTVDEAVSLVKEMQDLLKQGGFVLNKFMSSSRQVVQTIPEEDRAKSWQKDLSDSSLPQESALGLKWNVENDCFVYETDFSLDDKPLTKRKLLSITSSLYDPLGFVSPVLLIPKLTQQELCRRSLEWDDQVPEDLLTDVVKWIEQVKSLSSLRIPRCIKPDSTGVAALELHVFSDASAFGYGAAVYAKYRVKDKVTVTLLFGKSRVAPIQLVSIPRLELTAAVLACKCFQFVMDELDLSVKSSHFWTDSQTVLKYVENTATRFKAFVAHRVAAIHEVSRPSQWSFVPTSKNPADHASRGVWPQDECRITQWIEGPEFLRNDVQDYKALFDSPKDAPSIELEVKAVNVEQDSKAQVVRKPDEQPLEKLLHRYSVYHRLIKGVAWILKFIEYHHTGTVSSKELSVHDLQRAEQRILRFIQRQAFKTERKQLQKDGFVTLNSPIAQLDPYLDDQGFVRVGGRLEKCTGIEERHPIILPKHFVTVLIIRELHQANAHAGVNFVLSMLRRKFYVMTAYSMVRRIIRQCVECRKLFAKPQEQKMANLPEARVALNEPPFSRVGVDYFGPMQVKYRRGTVKRWGCVFTCLTTRAVHLEVAYEMTADSFLLAFGRFVARRGVPKVVYSDNGSNFTAAEKELKDELEAINAQRIETALLRHHIEWHFIPPRAPHMGGVWESIVKLVKKTLRGLVTRRLLDDEELQSFLTESEKVLNDRPLTRMGSDVRDAPPLTPSDLLLLKPNASHSQIAEDNPLKRRWAIVQELANKFFVRFADEYLPTLQVRSKWLRERRSLRENDIVLVVDEELKRGQWPLGAIVEPLTSEDGLVRSAKVKIGDNIKIRPIDKLVYLELNEQEFDAEVLPSSKHQDSNE